MLSHSVLLSENKTFYKKIHSNYFQSFYIIMKLIFVLLDKNSQTKYNSCCGIYLNGGAEVVDGKF